MEGKCKPILLLLFLFIASPAFAVDTARTYNSGILVLAFIGFLALILIVQMFPALKTLFGWIKSLYRGSAAAGERKKVESR